MTKEQLINSLELIVEQYRCNTYAEDNQRFMMVDILRLAIRELKGETATS